MAVPTVLVLSLVLAVSATASAALPQWIGMTVAPNDATKAALFGLGANGSRLAPDLATITLLNQHVTPDAFRCMPLGQ